jgi:hypothetical protein
MRDLDVVQRLLRQLAQHPGPSPGHRLRPAWPQPWLSTGWRDVADALTADQIAALAQRERAGCNPGMLLCEARELAAHNLDGWL